MENREIADRLDAFAAILELGDANPYTTRAYRRAADTIRLTPLAIATLVAEGRVRELRGIGPGIEARLAELLSTGTIAELAELERDLVPDLVGICRYLGLSAQRAIDIARALQIRTAQELRTAAAEGRLREVPGIGPKTEAQILAALAGEQRSEASAMWLSRADELLGGIAAAVGGEVAGDARRRCDSCRHLTVVAAAAEPRERLARFAALPQIVAVVEQGEQHAVGVTVDGVAVRCCVPPPERFGTGLVRETGTAAYLEGLGELPDAATEADLYARLGIPWLPPELREQLYRGEPPQLLEPAQIRGDLHMHSTWSDGRTSIREMAEAAIGRGYAYIAMCDHTPAVGAVRGLSADDVRRQGEEIDELNRELAPFRVLRGIECDILSDGSLDLPDAVLGELDWVQASVHGGQRMPGPEMTRRVCAALEHPAVSCLSHPTGRLIGRRPENALDLGAVFPLAASRGVALEVNGLPARLDLRGELVREALRVGVRIVCSTDAHSPAGLANMTLAVDTARRGWATAGEVLNTLPLEELLSRPRSAAG